MTQDDIPGVMGAPGGPGGLQGAPGHPVPGPIANVQVWEQRASEFWRFVACFFVTIHFSDAPVTLRRSPFQK